MTPLDVLLCMHYLIGQPERWTKGALARGEDDRKVSLTHPHACKFTLEGALYRVHWITRAKSCYAVHDLLRRTIDPRLVVSLEAFNNAQGTTHYAVMLKLAGAIRALGGTPPMEEEEE